MSSTLNNKLSQHWNCIQDNLFPWIEESLGPLSDKHRQLISVLEFADIDSHFSTYRGITPGRPPIDRASIACAFIAKAIYNLPTTRCLIDRLKVDKILRQICGFLHIHEIPSESVFSRAFAEFANTQLGEKIHDSLINSYHANRLVGHISRDATAIAAREKPLKKDPPKKEKKKRGRPKKDEVRAAPEPSRVERQLKMENVALMLADLPKHCDIGSKVNSKGHKISWRGYKLHLDIADGDIPISCALTSASTHDSQVAIPLATMTSKKVQSCYDLMDSAYDSVHIRMHSQSLGHVPLIDFNHRSKNDHRAFAPHEAERYKQRSSAERVNSRLKDSFNALCVRVKGHSKVMLHLMFGVIALTVDQMIRITTVTW